MKRFRGRKKMTSYQKRKEELKQAKEKAEKGPELAREIKHLFLALARGQAAHAEQVKKAVLRRASALWFFTEKEQKEICGDGEKL